MRADGMTLPRSLSQMSPYAEWSPDDVSIVERAGVIARPISDRSTGRA